MKKQLLGVSLILLMYGASAQAETTYDELDFIKCPAYRLGTGNQTENEYKIKETKAYEETLAKTKREIVKNKSYADSTLADLSKQLGKDIDYEKEDLVGDIAILWSGAASKSETVKFTIYKLSNPDADKPDDLIIKKVISPLAGFSTMAGAGLLNPVAATSAIMSGALVNSLSTNDKDLNYKYTKVTDADMILLLKRIDDLQQKLICEYIDYMTAYKALKRIDDIVAKRNRVVQSVKNSSRDIVLTADAYYRSALEEKRGIELEFLSKRARLEQIVGVDAMAEFEEVLKSRKNIK